jgi:hypothetical protein
MRDVSIADHARLRRARGAGAQPTRLLLDSVDTSPAFLATKDPRLAPMVDQHRAVFAIREPDVVPFSPLRALRKGHKAVAPEAGQRISPRGVVAPAVLIDPPRSSVRIVSPFERSTPVLVAVGEHGSLDAPLGTLAAAVDHLATAERTVALRASPGVPAEFAFLELRLGPERISDLATELFEPFSPCGGVRFELARLFWMLSGPGLVF